MIAFRVETNRITSRILSQLNGPFNFLSNDIKAKSVAQIVFENPEIEKSSVKFKLICNSRENKKEKQKNSGN